MLIQRPATSGRFRNIGLVIAALTVVLLSAAPMAFAGTTLAANATVLASTDGSDAAAGDRLNAEAVDRLIALGIIRGYDDGTVRATSNVTRAELAALLIRSLGLDNLATPTTYDLDFPDVGPACQWAHGYIALSAGRGLLTADPDGRFRPADSVTTVEAVTAVLRALGREPLVDPAQAWPEGHLALAESYGLGHISELAGAIATRSDVAGILAAALRLSIMEVGSDGALVDTGSSFLSRQDPGATIAEGDVTGTLSWYDDRYLIETATGLKAVTPGDATGLMVDGTRLLLNGEDVDEMRLRQAVCEPGIIALATVYVDASTGQGTMMSVATYDGQATYMQPLLAATDGSISIASGSDGGVRSREYRVAAEVWILRNGEWTDVNALQAGDYVSFRTDRSGEVVFINAVEDTDEPCLIGYRSVDDSERFLVFVDEALVPEDVSVTIDGSVCADWSLRYRGDLIFDQGRQLIVIPTPDWPREVSHKVDIVGRDHAGNCLRATVVVGGSLP